MQEEPVVYRDEVTSALFAIADINENIELIRKLLEEDSGGEETPDENSE